MLLYKFSFNWNRWLKQNSSLLSLLQTLRYFTRNFAKSAFCDVTKMQNAELPMVQSQTDLIVFSRKREKGLEHLLTTLSSLYFFNKTDFEKYFFR